jgi:flagellar biosynthesis/type III secretory pathway protein FliH
MIIHRVKFDRPFTNANLVDVLMSSELAVDGKVDAADGTSQAEPGASPIGQAGQTAEKKGESEAIEKLLAGISAGINDVNSQTGLWVDEIRSLSLCLTKMIVNRVVGSSETMRIQRLEHLLGEALSRPETPIAAFVHPDDYSMLSEFLKSVELNVQADASVGAGECRVEFSSHELVSSLQRQLDQIEDRLLEVLNDA